MVRLQNVSVPPVWLDMPSVEVPFFANETVPVATENETLKSSGVNFAGWIESAFFIASITALVAS